MCLSYATKMGWLTNVETAVQPVFDALATDVACLDDDSILVTDLLSLLPAAQQITEGVAEGQRAVPRGEEFRLDYHYAPLPSLTGSNMPVGWVSTWLPEPGLAPNIPWSVFVLLNAVWPTLPKPLRIGVRDIFKDLIDLVRGDGSLQAGDMRHLQLLFALISGRWHAVAV
jgi:hypothetical protein